MVGGSLYAAFLSSGPKIRASSLAGDPGSLVYGTGSGQVQQSLLSAPSAQNPSLAPQPSPNRQTSQPASSQQAVAPSAAGAAAAQRSGAGASQDDVRISAAGSTPQSAPRLNQQLCDTTVSPLFCVYTIVEGDTLASVAAKFGLQGNLEEDVTPWALLAHSNKPDITSENDILQLGQKLRIPTQNAVLHTVLSAQTLSEIAAMYDVSVADIVGLAVNGISNADSLKIGQEVLVPRPKRLFVPPPPAPTPAPAVAAPRPAGTGGAPQASRAVSGSGFIWPASGPISSYFGPAHPLGIDIDFYANPTQPVVAAAAGTVTFAGGNACCSYGLYVIVDHGNGYQTLYAHLSRIAVSTGQRVAQGEVLGYGGRTGYATGNHLHFEVHRNGSVVNPLSYLP